MHNSCNKPVNESARALLSFKRPTRHHRTATVGLPIIRNFHLGIGLRQMLLLPEFEAKWTDFLTQCSTIVCLKDPQR